MAAEPENHIGRRRKRKRKRPVDNNGRFSPGDQVEVKSEEDGFHGSWHPGTVIKCGRGVCHVRYNNIVIEDGRSRLLTEKVKVSAFADDSSECDDENQHDCGRLIRPQPNLLDVGVWGLNYGLCVDVCHMDIWWEGVVFDLEDGTKERRIFFPDLGDEMIVQIDAMRITQDWSEVTDTWQRRGTWLFLELLEDESLILPASVKQIWYDLRLKEGFQKIGQWTSMEKDLWTELIKEVINEHLIIFFRFVMQPISEIAFDGYTYTGSDVGCLAPVISSNAQGDFGQWKPVKPDLVPGAKSCPYAVTGYATASSEGNTKLQRSLTTNVRMHLLYLGWKIEYKRDIVREKSMSRFRYISPDGNMYHSLIQVCQALNGSTSELEFPSSITHDDQRSLIALPDDQLTFPLAVDFEKNEDGGYFLEAVQEYCNNYAAHKSNMKIRQKVKKHLEAMGWKFQQASRMVSGKPRVDVHCCSPSGKWFYSMRTACESCLNEEGISSKQRTLVELNHCHPEDQCSSLPELKRRKVSGALIKIGDGSDVSPPTRVMVSSKRVRQVAPSSSSFHIPRNILSWLIDNSAVLPRAKVFYRSRKDSCQLALAEGRITSKGIKCSCCQEVFTPSKFGIHAGNGSSGECASANIFLKDGRSLLDCQKQVINTINLTRVNHDRMKGTRHQGENDDLCTVCHYGGDLVLCDACPSAFHMSCLGLEDIPDGDWFCQSCCCRICCQCTLKADTEHLEDDPVNDICICDQCNKKYHLGCLITQKIATPRRNAGDSWFCSKKCGEIFNGLHKLIGISIPVGRANLTWTLLKPMQLDEHASDACVEALAEVYSKLGVALGVMHECFEPVKEPYTKRDLVGDVIFNRESELNRLNFQGFYTVLLERNDEVITVAAVRVYGEKVAEIPLVGTRFQHRRNGMCRILMNELEKRLEEVGVERLILPAIPSVLNTWTTSFGFTKMAKLERDKFLGYTFLDFQDTFMCQKFLREESSLQSCLTGRARPTTHVDINRTFAINGIDGSSAVSEVFQAEHIDGVARERVLEEYVSPPSEGGTLDQGLDDVDRCKEDAYRTSHDVGKRDGNLRCYQRRRR